MVHSKILINYLTRIFIIFIETISSSTIEVFVFELYSPYTNVFQNYSTYEQEQLKNALDAIQLVCIQNSLFFLIDIIFD
jgi:hypothetical protein